MPGATSAQVAGRLQYDLSVGRRELRSPGHNGDWVIATPSHPAAERLAHRVFGKNWAAGEWGEHSRFSHAAASSTLAALKGSISGLRNHPNLLAWGEVSPLGCLGHHPYQARPGVDRSSPYVNNGCLPAPSVWRTNGLCTSDRLSSLARSVCPGAACNLSYLDKWIVASAGSASPASTSTVLMIPTGTGQAGW